MTINNFFGQCFPCRHRSHVSRRCLFRRSDIFHTDFCWRSSLYFFSHAFPGPKTREYFLTAPGVLVIWSPIQVFPGPMLLNFGDQMRTGMSNVAKGRYLEKLPTRKMSVFIRLATLINAAGRTPFVPLHDEKPEL
jgi:hypothetical protein